MNDAVEIYELQDPAIAGGSYEDELQRFAIGAKVVPFGTSQVRVVDGVRRNKVLLKGSNGYVDQNQLRWAFPWEATGDKVDPQVHNTAEAKIQQEIRVLEANHPVVITMMHDGEKAKDWDNIKKRLLPDPKAEQIDISDIHKRYLDTIDLRDYYNNMGNGYSKALDLELGCMARSGNYPNVKVDGEAIKPAFEHIAMFFSAVGHSGSTYFIHISVINQILCGVLKSLKSGNFKTTTLLSFKQQELEVVGGSFAHYAFLPMFQNRNIVDPEWFKLSLEQVDLLIASLNVLAHKPMSPLLLDDEEFYEHPWGDIQNKRNGAVFKNKDLFDGKPYYLDAILFSDNSIDDRHEGFFSKGGDQGFGSAQPIDPEVGCVTRLVYLDVKALNLEPGYGPDGDMRNYQYIPPMGNVFVGMNVRKWDGSVWVVSSMSTDIDMDTERSVIVLTNSRGQEEIVDKAIFFHGVGEYNGFKYPLYFMIRDSKYFSMQDKKDD